MEIRINNPVTDDCYAVPDALWRVPGLSFNAKALAAYLAQFPQGFVPVVASVERETGLGRDARRAAYAELRGAGLLVSRSGTWSTAFSGVRP